MASFVERAYDRRLSLDDALKRDGAAFRTAGRAILPAALRRRRKAAAMVRLSERVEL